MVTPLVCVIKERVAVGPLLGMIREIHSPCYDRTLNIYFRLWVKVSQYLHRNFKKFRITVQEIVSEPLL